MAVLGAWRWTRLQGLRGGCCSSPWGLEVFVVAPHGALRWMLQVLVGFGGGHCGSLWGSEVDATAPYVASFPCPALVCSAGPGTRVQEEEEEEEGRGSSPA